MNLIKYVTADSHSFGFKFELVFIWRISAHILNTKNLGGGVVDYVKYKISHIPLAATSVPIC